MTRPHRHRLGIHRREFLQAGFSGPTHHCIEDLAVARSFPNMTVLAPADAVAAYWATLAAAAHPGPVYLRLAVDVTAQVYGEDCPFEIGKGNVLRQGGDLTIVAAGLTVVAEALQAAERLHAGGIEARVIDMHTVKPIDRELLAAAARETGLILTELRQRRPLFPVPHVQRSRPDRSRKYS